MYSQSCPHKCSEKAHDPSKECERYAHNHATGEPATERTDHRWNNRSFDSDCSNQKRVGDKRDNRPKRRSVHCPNPEVTYAPIPDMISGAAGATYKIAKG